MKIGIDGRAATLYRGTGIGTYTYQLISNINQVDKDNDYLIFSTEKSQASSLKDLNDNFHIKTVKNNVKDNFWNEVSIPNYLDNCKMDIYHVPQNGIGLSKNLDCNKIITLHDIIPLRMPETVSDRYLKIFNEQLPKLLNYCQGIITVSNYSKNDIAKEFNFPENKIFVTHLAAEDIYVPLCKSKAKKIINNKYGINTNFILYVGGLSPRKNIIGLIEAYSKLNNKLKEKNSLVIVGKKGLSYSRYKKRACDLNVSNKVIFTDFIPLNDLPLFYNACELLVYPSFYEGFGLPPLEAMACGTPVISSNVTSIPEICNDAAILVNPYNIDELSLAIEKVLTDNLLMLKMMNKGLIRSMNFSWKNTALSTIDAYKKII